MRFGHFGVRSYRGTLLIGSSFDQDIKFWQKALGQRRMPLAALAVLRDAQADRPGELQHLAMRLNLINHPMPMQDRQIGDAILHAIDTGRVAAAYLPTQFTHQIAVTPQPGNSRSWPAALRSPSQTQPTKAEPVSTPDIARMTAVQRVEEMLKRVPPKLVAARGLESAFLALISPESLGTLAACLIALTVAQAYGIGEVVDAALAGWAYYHAGVAGLWAVLDLVMSVKQATAAGTDSGIEKAASLCAGAVIILGTSVLFVVLQKAQRARGGGAENVISETGNASGVRRTTRQSSRDGRSASLTPNTTSEKAVRGIGSASDFGIPKFLSPRQSLHIEPVLDGRSILTAKPSTLLRELHEGSFTILRQPKPGQLVVDFSKEIGEYWSNGVKVGVTKFGSVSFGKNGAHIIPANPTQW